MRRFLKKIGRSLKGALGKGSQPRAGMAAEAMKGGFDPSKIIGGPISRGNVGKAIAGKVGPKDIDSSQRDKKTGAIRLGAAEAKPKAGLGGGGLGGNFKGILGKVAAAAAAKKAGAAEAKPKAGLGSGIGAVGKTLGGGTKSQAQKDKEEELFSAVKGFSKRKLRGFGFESGGAVKKASSKGRGMGAATQGGGAVGGAAKKKGYAMGGMAMKKGYAAGGPAMKKGYAMGGAAMKKGYASGGSARSK